MAGPGIWRIGNRSSSKQLFTGRLITGNCPKRALRNVQKNAPPGCFKGKPGSIFGRMAKSVPIATG